MALSGSLGELLVLRAISIQASFRLQESGQSNLKLRYSNTIRWQWQVARSKKQGSKSPVQPANGSAAAKCPEPSQY